MKQLLRNHIYFILSSDETVYLCSTLCMEWMLQSGKLNFKEELKFNLRSLEVVFAFLRTVHPKIKSIEIRGQETSLKMAVPVSDSQNVA